MKASDTPVGQWWKQCRERAIGRGIGLARQPVDADWSSEPDGRCFGVSVAGGVAALFAPDDGRGLELIRANFNRPLTRDEVSARDLAEGVFQRRHRNLAEELHRSNAASLAQLIKRAKPASPLHDHLVRCKLSPGGFLQDGDSLVLIARDFIKRPHGAALISPEGKLTFHPGTRIEGSYFQFGTPMAGNPLVLTPDPTTAAAIHQSRPTACTIATFTVPNLLPAGEAIAGRVRLLPYVAVSRAPDNDPDLAMARRAAGALRGRLATPPPDSPGTWLKLYTERGPEAIAAALRAARGW